MKVAVDRMPRGREMCGRWIFVLSPVWAFQVFFFPPLRSNCCGPLIWPCLATLHRILYAKSLLLKPQSPQLCHLLIWLLAIV